MNPEDATTEGEIADDTQLALSSASSSKPRDAFSKLMSPKRKTPSSPPTASKRTSTNPISLVKRLVGPFIGKDGLGAYILHPEDYPSSTVIWHNDSFVAIVDLYPKSSVHYLLLPRSEKHTHLHPFEAFEDAEFLAAVRADAKKLKRLAGKELQSRYGPFSKRDEPREAVLNGDVDADELPVGRDWEKDIKVGIHAHPSMNHLHIHVISVDRYSECLKHQKHYNSFATPFFVDLEDFPLAEGDVRRHPGKEGYLKSDLKCWRCGRNFGNRFARLKEHLQLEFEEWKKE